MKNKATTFDYSPIALRALVRHKIAPPTKFFADKKKNASKKACRNIDENKHVLGP